MQELGFRPSYAGRSLRDGRYHSVGLCVNDVTKFGNLSMIDGIASAAREHNCAITLVEMSKKLDLPLIATNDAHYLKRSDAEWHDILLCVAENAIEHLPAEDQAQGHNHEG